MALLGIALLLMEDQHTAMRFLAPMAHCLGCLVGIVFGLYFNHLGINAVSGCLLGIISAALIMQSIKVIYLTCVTLTGLDLGLVLLKCYCLALFHYPRWVLTMLTSPGDYHIDKVFMFSIFIIYLIKHFTIYGAISFLFTGLFIGFFAASIGIVIQDREFEDAYFVSPILAFAAVGWYYFGFIGIPICTFAGLFTGIFMTVLTMVDEDVWGDVTGNLVLCFTFRLLGVGIGSFLVPSLCSFFDLLASLLAEKAIRMFSCSFMRSVWQYTANLGGRNDIVYGAFMWMKQNHEGLLGSVGLSLAMLIGIGSGAFLGGLCGHAVLMLANHSHDARVAGWSLMVSGSVVGALTAYSAFGLKASVPVGAFLGCSITAAILLWRGGFNFKSYFQRTIQSGRVWEIFNRARMGR